MDDLRMVTAFMRSAEFWILRICDVCGALIFLSICYTLTLCVLNDFPQLKPSWNRPAKPPPTRLPVKRRNREIVTKPTSVEEEKSEAEEVPSTSTEPTEISIESIARPLANRQKISERRWEQRDLKSMEDRF